MRDISKEELKDILEQHRKWRFGEDGGECASLRGADLSYADLRYADLRYADLSDADLRYADLREIKSLWAATGNLREIKSLFISEDYAIVYTDTYLQIGCEKHKIADWWEFDNKRIAEMDGKKALEFWKDNKDYIRQTTEKFPAVSSLIKGEDNNGE